jgi:hypothetical protein
MMRIDALVAEEMMVWLGSHPWAMIVVLTAVFKIWTSSAHR